MMMWCDTYSAASITVPPHLADRLWHIGCPSLFEAQHGLAVDAGPGFPAHVSVIPVTGVREQRASTPWGAAPRSQERPDSVIAFKGRRLGTDYRFGELRPLAAAYREATSAIVPPKAPWRSV
jgi:hypothetical protein